jgi:D-tyrosyl-tRNA(Tyr) deacylase
MIALIQRVDEAQVYIDEVLKSHIEKGLLVFLGIELDDNFSDADYLLEKVINLRVFEDHLGKMNFSVLDIDGELLIVSQFTLLSDCKKGRRPSFTRAEQPQKAKMLYDYFIEKGNRIYGKISCGEFQAMMKIQLINDGPVTISINSRE